MAYTIRVNPLLIPQVDVEIPEIGMVIPAGPGELIEDLTELYDLQKSIDFRGDATRTGLLTDDGHAAGESTLIIEFNAAKVPQADVQHFLDTHLLPDASNNYGVVQNNGSGQIDTALDFAPGATLSNVQLANSMDAGNNAITNVAAPTSASDAANKAYVDAIAQGLDTKAGARALADANITLSGTQTIDGVALVAGERVLLTGQTIGAENGIWEVQAGAWTRPADFANTSSAAGAYLFVEEGTTYADTGWVCISDAGSDVVGTDPLAWTQFNGAGSITAGDGLTKTGNTLDVVAGDGIIANANDITVDFGTGIQDVGAANNAGTSTQVARVDHTHAHGDRSVDGAVTHHTAAQVAVAGTYTNIGSPTDVEQALANIDANINTGNNTKTLQFGLNGRIRDNGRTRYLENAGSVGSRKAGLRMLRAGTIEAASLQVGNDADANNVYELRFYLNDTLQTGVVTLPVGQEGAINTTLSISYNAGDVLSVGIRRVSGSTESNFNAMSALVEIQE